MPARTWTMLTVLFLSALPTPARPADTEDAKTPTVVLRVQSIQSLIDDSIYLATMAGKEEQAKQGQGFLKSLMDDKGLQGIDVKRPLGFYGFLKQDFLNSPAALLVPIADEKAFLGALENYNLKVKKGDDGLHTVSVEQLPVLPPIYFRFHKQYAYITIQNKEALDKNKLLDPDKVLDAGHKKDAVSGYFQIDQVPDFVKQLVLGRVELGLAEAKDKQDPNVTEAVKALRSELVKETAQLIAGVVTEGGQVEFALHIDRTAGDVVTEVSLAGKPHSRMAAHIQKMGEAKSLFAGLLSGDSAVEGLLHLSLPHDLRKVFDPVIDEGIRKGLENEKDEGKRRLGEKFLKVFEPTFKSGELDLGVNFRGPDKDMHYTMVLGIKVKDGKAIEDAVREVVATIPEKDRDKIKLDAESAGDVKIHRLDAQTALDAKARRLVGENPVIYVAIREDAILVSAGPNGLKALQEAVAVAPKAGPLFDLQLVPSRMAELMVEEHPNAVQIAQDVFGKDRMRFTVTGGQALKFRFDFKTAVVKFLGQLDKDGKKAKPESESKDK